MSPETLNQLHEINMRLTAKRLSNASAKRNMDAPVLLSAFTAPYSISRFPKRPLPPVNVTKRMTYEEAYEAASIAAAETVGPNAHEYSALQEQLLDELCIKHDIE